VNKRSKIYKLLLLAVFFILATPGYAHAYIGPGAGFAVVGSFFVMFTAFLAGIAALITFPIRYLIRAIRGRRAFARARIKKCVILGLDGLDPKLAETFMAEGNYPILSGSVTRDALNNSLRPSLPSHPWPGHPFKQASIPESTTSLIFSPATSILICRN